MRTVTSENYLSQYNKSFHTFTFIPLYTEVASMLTWVEAAWKVAAEMRGLKQSVVLGRKTLLGDWLGSWFGSSSSTGSESKVVWRDRETGAIVEREFCFECENEEYFKHVR